MNTQLNEPENSTPWYRSFWPWFLFFFPAVAVVGCLITIWLAIITDDGLVSDDYYKEGLAISQKLSQDDLSRQKNLAALIRLNSRNEQVEVYLEGQFDRTDQLKMYFIHPTQSGKDMALTLGLIDGVLSGKLPALTAANWHVRLETDDKRWRLSGRLQWPAVQQVRLLP